LNPLGAKDTYPIIGMRKADERTQAPIAEIQLRSLLQRGERRVQTPESFKASTYRRTAAACGTFAANARFAGNASTFNPIGGDFSAAAEDVGAFISFSVRGFGFVSSLTRTIFPLRLTTV
jgi:hypothetical protein